MPESQSLTDMLLTLWQALPLVIQYAVIIVGLMILPIVITVALLTYAERRVIGAMQGRIGPNRVGFFGFRLMGLGQAFADVVKLILKEIIVPSASNRFLFIIAPMLLISRFVQRYFVKGLVAGAIR